MGYHQAGYEVVGVDINPQPEYPFTFIQADAMKMLRGDIVGGGIAGYDAYHMSPPCQRYSTLTPSPEDHPDYLQQVITIAQTLDAPWVVENVPNAEYGVLPLSNLTLCGSMFPELQVKYKGTVFGLRRHRAFWTNFTVPQPPCNHALMPVDVTGRMAKMPNKWRRDNPLESSGMDHDATTWLMGINWITRKNARMLSEAIPPAYTRHIVQYIPR
jgi:DNA (cytosine-5)-methyltransferase 1